MKTGKAAPPVTQGIDEAALLAKQSQYLLMLRLRQPVQQWQ